MGEGTARPIVKFQSFLNCGRLTIILLPVRRERAGVRFHSAASTPIITAISQSSSTARVRLKPARTSRCERWLVSPIQNGLRLSVRKMTTYARSTSGTASTSNGDNTASGRGFCLV